MPFLTQPPLSLYIHLPWCVRKCPYCDFNSHAVKSSIPETAYVQTLLQELDRHLSSFSANSLVSIFFGGGTPSLFSPQAIEHILNGVNERLPITQQTEITLEANPGAVDEARFQGFRRAGVNRLSLGIQSLQDEKLKVLGRIHDAANAKNAIQTAKLAGFTNFNIDLMFGLPNQSIHDALYDLTQALSFEPTHLSWYQLTIEPNTVFYKQTPILPEDELIWDMQSAGQALLSDAGLHQYEISAYSQTGKACLHNRNYWEFGDYLGIGAGAHSKLTDVKNQAVLRLAQVKQPKDYLMLDKHRAEATKIAEEHLVFEFMLNALRLKDGVPASLFSERTGVALESIQPTLDKAIKLGLLSPDLNQLCATQKGYHFLNELTLLFLPKD